MTTLTLSRDGLEQVDEVELFKGSEVLSSYNMEMAQLTPHRLSISNNRDLVLFKITEYGDFSSGIPTEQTTE